MEYWSVKKKDIDLIALTPPLHYSNTPELDEIERFQKELPLFWVVDLLKNLYLY